MAYSRWLILCAQKFQRLQDLLSSSGALVDQEPALLLRDVVEIGLHDGVDGCLPYREADLEGPVTVEDPVRGAGAGAAR